MNKTWAKYTRFSIWIIPHWRRIQTPLLNPTLLGTAIFRCHAVIYLSIGRCESRERYFRAGKLIIGAAKLINLVNYIKIFRGYFTKYIHASTLFQHEHFSLKANARLKYTSHLMTPGEWLSFRRFTSKLSCKLSWWLNQQNDLYAQRRLRCLSIRPVWS